jgi:hypothetical protein
MSLLASIRLHHLRASRLVTAVSAVAWLGFAAAPCQASPHHEPVPAEDCGHCPVATTETGTPCTVIDAVDCPSLEPALLDRRDAGDQDPQVALPPAVWQFNAPPAGIGADAAGRVASAPVSHVSLQQRYCSYLK